MKRLKSLLHGSVLMSRLTPSFMQKKMTLYSLLLAFFFLAGKRAEAQAPGFTIGSVPQVNGSTLVVPVTVRNFTQLLAWQGSVNWDNSKLTFSGVSAPVAQLTGMQFNPSVSGNTGRLSFVWYDSNLAPQTISDSTVLFQLTFSVAGGAAGSSDIVFANNPTQLLVSNAANEMVANVEYTKGTVHFPGTALTPEFTIGSVPNVSTTTVTVPVTAKNFIQLLAWQGSLTWDNTRLTFASVSAPFSQLAGMQFNPSVSGSTGRLSFVWADENLQGQSVPDNAVLFSLVFNVVVNTGITEVQFGNSPTPLSVSNAAGAAVANVVYTKGSVSFPGAFLPPVFQIGSQYNVDSSTISIPVTAQNFTQLSGWQGSVQWDNTRLQFSGITAQHTQLSGISFNASVKDTTGRLSFIWVDANAGSQTIAANAVLFVLNFSVQKNSGRSDIVFAHSPTPLFVSNGAGLAVNNTGYQPGVVTFTSRICNGGNTTLSSNLTGAGYQWQVNRGSGFENLNDDAHHAGTTAITLALQNVPTSWSGYQYRCLVNGNFSTLYALKFKDYWIGTNSNWENNGMWTCGVPDANTDVIIPAGNVQLNSNTSVKSVTIVPGATLTIKAGQQLVITGN